MENPPFDETALRISPSPPPSKGSASSAIESKYLRQVRLLNYIRLGLAVALIGLGSAVVGSEGHALHSYNKTHLSSEWWLPLWPQYFDLRPTITLLTGAAITVFASLLFFIVAIIPSPRSHLTLQNITYTMTISLSFIASLLTLAYTAHVNHDNKKTSHFSLQTWTCQWAGGVDASSVTEAAGTSEFSANMFGLNGGIPPPEGFSRICSETKASWAIVITMVVLEGALGGLTVLAGWWFGFGVWRERRREQKYGDGSRFNEEWVMQNTNANANANE